VILANTGDLAAIITAASGFITAVGAVIWQHRRYSKDAARIGEDIKRHSSTQAIKANGVPISHLDNSPFPAWSKELNGRMLYINPAYTSEFGVTLEEYRGKSDQEVWGDAGVAFRTHDIEVLAAGHRIQQRELVPTDRHDPGSPLREITVVKWISRDPQTGQPKHLCGMAITADISERMLSTIDYHVIPKPSTETP
jgi:PAS domain-containing protein